MRPFGRLSMAVVLVLGLAGCGQGGNGGFGNPVSPPGGQGSPSPAAQASPSPSPSRPPRTITVRTPGMRFEPADLRLRTGRTNVIELANSDSVTHTLEIDELNLHMTAYPGETVRLPITLEISARALPFEMFCSIPGHRAAGMTGTVRVV